MKKRIEIHIDIQEEGSCRGCKYHTYNKCIAYDMPIRTDGTKQLFYPVRCKDCIDSEKRLDKR